MTVDGFKDISFHIKGRAISSEKIEDLRQSMAEILEMQLENVLYRGGEITQSFLLKFMIPEENARILQDKDVLYSRQLSEIGVDSLRLHGKEIEIHHPGRIKLNAFRFTIVTRKHYDLIHVFYILFKCVPIKFPDVFENSM